MSKRLSQKELESYLWGAATLLRGRNLSTTVRHVRATFTEHPQAKRPRFRRCLEG